MPGRALRILIVEDHLLIAKQLEYIAFSAGHVVVGTAATGDEACALVQTAQPEIVFLDVNLAGPASGVDAANFIARHCDARVVFTTASRRRLPSDFCGAIGVVEKPFTREGVLAAMRLVSARLQDQSETVAPPDSLRLAPFYSARWQHRA